MLSDIVCGLCPDERLQFFGARFRNTLDRAELTKQLQLSFVSDAGNFGKFGSKIALFATFAVKLDRRFMGLFADLQNKAHCKRIAIERDRVVLASVDQQV